MNAMGMTLLLLVMDRVLVMATIHYSRILTFARVFITHSC